MSNLEIYMIWDSDCTMNPYCRNKLPLIVCFSSVFVDRRNVSYIDIHKLLIVIVWKKCAIFFDGGFSPNADAKRYYLVRVYFGSLNIAILLTIAAKVCEIFHNIFDSWLVLYRIEISRKSPIRTIELCNAYI